MVHDLIHIFLGLTGLLDLQIMCPHSTPFFVRYSIWLCS